MKEIDVMCASLFAQEETPFIFCLRDGRMFFSFFMGVEIEQAVRPALTDGQEPACSISLYLVQIQIFSLYVHVFQASWFAFMILYVFRV